MPTLSDRSAFSAAALAGAASWLAISIGTGHREVWTSEWYFVLVLPGIAMLVSWLAFLAPKRAWLWAFVPFAAQAAVASLQLPAPDFLPAGLIVFGAFGVVCLVPALVAAWFRRWYDRQGAGA